MLDRKDQVSFVAKPCFLPIAKLWRAETPRRAVSTGKQAACESKRLGPAAVSAAGCPCSSPNRASCDHSDQRKLYSLRGGAIALGWRLLHSGAKASCLIG